MLLVLLVFDTRRGQPDESGQSFEHGESSDAAYNETVDRLKLSDYQNMTNRLPSGTFNRSRGWAAAVERLLLSKAIGTLCGSLLNVTRESLLESSSQTGL